MIDFLSALFKLLFWIAVVVALFKAIFVHTTGAILGSSLVILGLYLIRTLLDD